MLLWFQRTFQAQSKCGSGWFNGSKRYAAADLNQDGEKADSPFETLMSHLFPCKPAKMTGWDLLEQKTWGYMEDTLIPSGAQGHCSYFDNTVRSNPSITSLIFFLLGGERLIGAAQLAPGYPGERAGIRAGSLHYSGAREPSNLHGELHPCRRTRRLRGGHLGMPSRGPSSLRMALARAADCTGMSSAVPVLPMPLPGSQPGAPTAPTSDFGGGESSSGFLGCCTPSLFPPPQQKEPCPWL